MTGDGTTRLIFEPLGVAHAAELSEALFDPRVYEFLPDSAPKTPAELAGRLARLVAGPTGADPHEAWLNYVVRLRSGEAIGHIQATIHDRLAETAFLFGVGFQGRGYATESLLWLHDAIAKSGFADSLWATTLPTNTRSIRLLERTGYELVTIDRPALRSYDPGDLVFRVSLPQILGRIE